MFLDTAQTRFNRATVAAVAVTAALWALPLSAGAQPQPPAAAAAATPPSRTGAPVAKPLWSELSDTQRQALAPLSGQWDTLTEPHKRKWIALAGNFQRLPPAEQAKLHSRMAEWIALSPRQRTEARLNFGETQQLSPDAKKAKWEAYQALPDEEKRRLAASAPAKTAATAAAIRPVPSQKLASVPRNPNADAKPPRILGAPPAP